MSRVYNHPSAELGRCVGHTGPDGQIYDHPTAEAGHCVGRVAGDGQIYGPGEAASIGYVTADGKIYRSDGASGCVGRVAADGRIYNGPDEKAERCVGHVEAGCPLHHAGGGAMLLLLKNSGGAKQEPPERPWQESASGGEVPQSNPNLYGKLWALVGILLVISLVGTLLRMAPILLLLIVGCAALFASRKYKGYCDQGIPDPQTVEQAKQDARSWALAGTGIALAASVLAIILMGSWQTLFLLLLPLDYLLLWQFIWQEMVMGKFPGRPLFQMPAFSAGQRPPKQPKPPKEPKPSKKPKEQEPPRPTGEPQDSAYNYFTCPKCRRALRVPKGKGKIQITCPKCGEKFLAQD